MTDPTISRTAEKDEGPDDAGVHDGDEATVVDALDEPTADVAAIEPDALASPHRSRVVAVPLLAALLFFFGPAVAFLLGDRSEEIDNRPLAAMPSAGEGWSFFPDFTIWANDHLPLRSHAVRSGTELSETVFAEPPDYGQAAAADGVQYPRVIRGSDGWLYFGGDVSGACNPHLSVDEIVHSLVRLDTAIEASGRTLVLAIVPDKSTMVPEHLPDQFAGEECAAERREALWAGVSSAELPLIDMRAALGRAQERTGTTLYRKTDSHWTPQGASVLVEEVVGRLDPALVATDPSPFVEGGQIQLRGDLGAMLGTPTRDDAVEVTVERPGVTLSVGGRTVEPGDIPGLGAQPVGIDGSSTGAPLIPGRTAALGDSFFASARPLLAPFFDDLWLVHNQSDPGVLAQLIVDSDTVVVELVERSVAAGEATLTTPAAVDVIEQALAVNPRRP